MKFLDELTNSDKEFILNELPHIGDILAITFIFPYFAYYFYIIEKRSPFEWYLLIVAILSLLADIFFTIMHYKKIEFEKENNKKNIDNGQT
jgi:hypothetical protein